MKVYPRVCGGIIIYGGLGLRRRGLSPRVRGNQVLRLHDRVRLGSIPACAGESRCHLYFSAKFLVYPRVCGGIRCGQPAPQYMYGLSPRVRGNLLSWMHGNATYRSIPACAGESGDGRDILFLKGVYPRVCGGISTTKSVSLQEYGLSPRVRGNLLTSPPQLSQIGSIPACAGESYPVFLVSPAVWVYPRVCGGIPFLSHLSAWHLGLSPRVRGNLTGNKSLVVKVRSIPACAGESIWRWSRKDVLRVYPRVCGGIFCLFRHLSRCSGLSPRVRGNLFQ